MEEPASAPPARAACSLHIRVRTFAIFGDEAVDPRRDNGQRHDKLWRVSVLRVVVSFLFRIPTQKPIRTRNESGSPESRKWDFRDRRQNCEGSSEREREPSEFQSR